jgi:hypothetical protein
MQQFIINISDEDSSSKLLQFLKKLKIDFVASSQQNTPAITDEEKAFIEEALKDLEENPNAMVSWKDLRHQLKSKRK